MISLETIESGVILPVRAMPGSRKNEVRGEQNGSLKVSVTQVPEKGKANKAVQEQLAKSLKLRVSQIQLLSGETGRQKKFLIIGITAEELTAAIAPLL
ncbi:MAG: DUF167 domain-containing protein [Planctomycetaceae bacterium]|jgi:uncharacterized protein (TIGR00251 family)|nr:DUF167 domain-containing protein [Planctomycetaceae bacterium]